MLKDFLNLMRLEDSVRDYDGVLDLVGEADLVLLGEASHGTHEFYRERARITRRLIREKGFNGVAVEADWPDAYRVNRFVRGEGDDRDPQQALSDFRRFPRWMWRNTDVVQFVSWLRAHNQERPPAAPRVGFYGLDLFSLYPSIEAVLRYLEKVDPREAELARTRYAGFEPFGNDPLAYGQAACTDLSYSCETQVMRQLLQLYQSAIKYRSVADGASVEEYFFAAQNARLARNAERYYRALFQGRSACWNLRDQHMAETVEALLAHIARQTPRPKLVVWAHNSHVGDARLTELAQRGEISLGQLLRERYRRNVLLVGFSTYQGNVIAAREWDAPAEQRRVRPALPGSYEALLHELGEPRFVLPLRNNAAAAVQLAQPRLERAIGAVYRTDSERSSHYFEATLANQFDAVIHLDRTGAVQPLDECGLAVEPPASEPRAVQRVNRGESSWREEPSSQHSRAASPYRSEMRNCRPT